MSPNFDAFKKFFRGLGYWAISSSAKATFDAFFYVRPRTDCSWVVWKPDRQTDRQTDRHFSRQVIPVGGPKAPPPAPGAQQLRDGDAAFEFNTRPPALEAAVFPAPATHSIWTVLKAGVCWDSTLDSGSGGQTI